MSKRPQAPKSKPRRPARDPSQTALSVVERAIGSKLAAPETKPKRRAPPKRR